jgi:hypothetical protein
MADGAPWRGQVGARCPSSTHGIAPTIVQQELAQWTVRELGELGEDEADPVVTCTQKCQVLAACLRRDHNLATADAIVSASALHTGARPIRGEAHFSKLPRVICVAKCSRHLTGPGLFVTARVGTPLPK